MRSDPASLIFCGPHEREVNAPQGAPLPKKGGGGVGSISQSPILVPLCSYPSDRGHGSPHVRSEPLPQTISGMLAKRRSRASSIDGGRGTEPSLLKPAAGRNGALGKCGGREAHANRVLPRSSDVQVWQEQPRHTTRCGGTSVWGNRKVPPARSGAASHVWQRPAVGHTKYTYLLSDIISDWDQLEHVLGSGLDCCM